MCCSPRGVQECCIPAWMGGSWAGQCPLPTHWRFAALGRLERLETAYWNSSCVLEGSSLGEGSRAAVPAPAEPHQELVPDALLQSAQVPGVGLRFGVMWFLLGGSLGLELSIQKGQTGARCKGSTWR